MNSFELPPLESTKIKICGILPEDMEDVAILSPNGVGFYDWPREERGSTPTTREGARYIAKYATACGIDPYYLTYETDSEKIFADCQDVFADSSGGATPHVQLVGDISPDEVITLSKHLKNESPKERRQTKLVQSLGVAAAKDESIASGRDGEYYWFCNTDLVDEYIFDSHQAEQHGGTGKVHAWGWSLIGMYYMRAIKGPPVWLAGGLNLSNIDDALKIHPYGVDIESGVQNKDGSKNFMTMRKLIQKVHDFQPIQSS